MHNSHIIRPSGMQLYDTRFRRLYINPYERCGFIKAAQRQEAMIRCFCLVLTYTGCRISEGLALQSQSIQVENGIVAFRTLKQRDHFAIREVPVPIWLTRELDSMLQTSSRKDNQTIWHADDVPVPRHTAYRWVKQVMREAGIKGKMASPKGLRHGFGIHAMLSGVQLNMLQKWMGHTSIETTAIYANAMGKEERAIAQRMWVKEKPAEISAG